MGSIYFQLGLWLMNVAINDLTFMAKLIEGWGMTWLYCRKLMVEINRELWDHKTHDDLEVSTIQVDSTYKLNLLF